MKLINAQNPWQLEKFADQVERTVVTLKDNKHTSDLKGGTLYAIVLEKIPQSLLSQYYRWKGKTGVSWGIGRMGRQRKWNTKFKTWGQAFAS